MIQPGPTLPDTHDDGRAAGRRAGRRGGRLAALALAAAWIGWGGSGAGADALAPHEALYAVSVRAGPAGAPVLPAEGGLTVKLERACDGWLLAMHMALRGTSPELEAFRLESRTAMWESEDGRRFRFASRDIGPAGSSTIRGTAVLGAGGDGTASFREPRAQEVPLPSGTLFPISQTRAIIAAAEAGRDSFSGPLFVGESLDGPRMASVRIGPRVTAAEMAGRYPPDRVGDLARGAGWPTRMALFPLHEPDATPSSESDLLQLANGVAARMVMDMGVLRMIAALERVRPLPEPSC